MIMMMHRQGNLCFSCMCLFILHTSVSVLFLCLVVSGIGSGLSLWHTLPAPGHAKTWLIPYANNKGADQPAHPGSLISTFVVRCLDSMICILAISKVSRF